MTPREATLQAMREVSGPVIYRACAFPVFIPTAFFPGYRTFVQQFALNDSDLRHLIRVQRAFAQSGTVIALAAAAKRKRAARSAGFYDRFNRVFGSATHVYVNWSRLPFEKPSSASLARRVRVGAGLFDRDCRVDSYRKKIKATFSRASVYPTHRHSNIPTTAARRSKTFSAKFPAFSTRPASSDQFLLISCKTLTARSSSSRQARMRMNKTGRKIHAIKANINKKLAGLTEGLAFAFPPAGDFLAWALPADSNSFWEERTGKDVAFLAKNMKDVFGRGA